MRDRTLVTRLLAALLTIIWAAGALLVLTAYRPGGPADILVGATALLPALIAAVAVVWPPVMTGQRGSARGATNGRQLWPAVIAIGSALLLVPSVAGVVGTLAQGPGRPLIPSAETAYGFLLPLLGTCLLAGIGLVGALGIAQRSQRGRLLAGVALGLVLAIVSSVLFAGATIANDTGLRAQLGASRWGPTARDITPPRCNGALVDAETATVTVEGSARVDSTDAGRFSLSGTRSGIDERWQASVEAHRIIGDFAHVRIGDRAWEQRADGPWRPQAPSAAMPTLDSAVTSAALTPAARATAEEVGIEDVGGARARHCRLAVDGPTALRAVPAARWLIGREPFDRSPALDVWRGDMDWWVFVDGSVGMTAISIHGPAFGGDWPETGFQVTIDARVTALDRGMPQTIQPPI
jgi:hypothetical protein